MKITFEFAIFSTENQNLKKNTNACKSRTKCAKVQICKGLKFRNLYRTKIFGLRTTLVKPYLILNFGCQVTNNPFWELFSMLFLACLRLRSQYCLQFRVQFVYNSQSNGPFGQTCKNLLPKTNYPRNKKSLFTCSLAAF